MQLIFDDFKKLRLPYPSMSEDEFFDFCTSNPEIPMERDRHGNILLMEPTGSEGGSQEIEVGADLVVWNRRTGLGKTFGPTAGFTLPSKAVRAADAAWIAKARWEKVAAYDRPRFAHITPDFVLEIRSPSDSVKELRAKMEEWIEAGVRLAFLTDPIEGQAWVYRTDGSVDSPVGMDAALSGEDVLPGFSLPLSIFAE